MSRLFNSHFIRFPLASQYECLQYLSNKYQTCESWIKLGKSCHGTSTAKRKIFVNLVIGH